MKTKKAVYLFAGLLLMATAVEQAYQKDILAVAPFVCAIYLLVRFFQIKS